jgi:hypothetical protein
MIEKLQLVVRGLGSAMRAVQAKSAGKIALASVSSRGDTGYPARHFRITTTRYKFPLLGRKSRSRFLVALQDCDSRAQLAGNNTMLTPAPKE